MHDSHFQYRYLEEIRSSRQEAGVRPDENIRTKREGEAGQNQNDGQ